MSGTLPSMQTAWTIGSAILFFVVVMFVVRMFVQSLRGRGRAAIDKRYPASKVVLSETLTQSFGQQSKGAAQLRGSGALALTDTELFFMMYVPSREVVIPLSAIVAVSLVRSHLGKTQGVNLLHVRYTGEGIEDAIAWRLPAPEAWKAKIEALHASAQRDAAP